MRLETSRAVLLAVLLAGRCMAFGPASAGAAAGFDPAPWLEDFQQLLSELSSHYANLDWAIEERRMDLPHLREQTELKLRAATNEEEARRVLRQFLDSFGDGHLDIRWPQPPEAPSPSLQARICATPSDTILGCRPDWAFRLFQASGCSTTRIPGFSSPACFA